MSANQTDGRKSNAAQPLGDKVGLVSNGGRDRTGEKSTSAAGPDGPDAGAVGQTFKGKPDGGVAQATHGGKAQGGGADAGATTDDPGRGGD
jgi:hypothetical protein